MAASTRHHPFNITLQNVWEVATLSWVPMTQPGAAAGGGDASAANQVTEIASLASVDGKIPALVGGRVPVVLPAGGSGLTDTELRAAAVPVSAAALPLPSGASTAALQTTGNTSVGSIDTKTPALGQALAAASVPVILPAATITTLTPPAAITGFALEAGHLSTIDTKTPALGQALAASSTPVVLTAAQMTTLTPLATVAVTGTFWQATQPVSGTFWQATQPVSGTINPATSAGKTLTYVPVAQGAAGTTQLAAASGAAKHKVVGCILTLSALGTLKFTDASGDLTGAMDVAATGGFVLPTALFPYTETGAVNRAINIVTTGGAAKGVVVLLTEA
jgi:hypothetical protein